METWQHGAVMHKETGIRVAVGITCGLSILGSSLIIASYILFREVRTRARLILFHLSLMDLGVGLANLAGDVVRFEQFYVHNSTLVTDPGTVPRVFCEAQAFFAMFFTISSILWTCVIAVYMYFLAVEKSSSFMKLFMWVSYLMCYGIPLMVSTWVLLTGRLGYAPYNSGWCTLIVKRLPTSSSSVHRWSNTDIYGTVFSYDIWIVTSLILTVVVYLSTHYYIRNERAVRKFTSHSNTLFNVEFKFLLIPVLFILLRIWSLINNSVFVYAGLDAADVPKTFLTFIIYTAGIGDSGQGAVNGLIFVVLTPDVRKKLGSCACLRTREDGHSSTRFPNQSPQVPAANRQLQKAEKPEPESPSVYTPLSSYES